MAAAADGVAAERAAAEVVAGAVEEVGVGARIAVEAVVVPPAAGPAVVVAEVVDPAAAAALASNGSGGTLSRQWIS